MPSARRLRVMLVLALAAIVTVLLFTSHLRASQEQDSMSLQDFYHKTVNAMDGKRGSGGAQIIMGNKVPTVNAEAKDKDGDGTIDEDDEKMSEAMAERLRAAEQKAKELANAKAPLKPDSPEKVVGVGSSAGGQNSKGKDKDDADEEKSPKDTKEDTVIQIILKDILKKSPVIIFSKTYCPFSKRAKALLLEKYSIDPAPYVVELDVHDMGKELQDELELMTGRKTVPNIMINGMSLGGSDDIALMDSRGTLVDKVKSMGGKRVSMKERFQDHTNSQ
ncbi:thioredoxin-like protein [Xylariales sp. PMI_506]|nr:thioredoxin-like protein [Xylariales sp. PMI_506]